MPLVSPGAFAPDMPASAWRVTSDLFVQRRSRHTPLTHASRPFFTLVWCQKTVEVKVVCTNTCCSIGRLPVLMCASCLANRHGEDVTAAIESGNWICPRCRDGCCGQGRHTKGADSSCIGCCNCSACRKKAKLEATGLIKHDAFRAGFSNAHDYLAGQKLGKTQEQMDDIRVARGWAHWSLDAAVRARAPALPAGAAPGPFVAGAAPEAPPAAPASPVQRDDHQADVSTDSAQPPAAAQHIGDDSSEDVPPGFAGVAPRVAVTVTDMFRAVRTPAEQMAILLKRKSETEATSSKRRIRK
jgi:Zinc-finger domain of monoamine-oxidase A repressor R1